MVHKLTDHFLQSIRPKPGRKTTVVYDGVVGGLSARFGARAVVEWSVAYRVRGDRFQYRQKLGHYPDMSLDQARAAAAAIKARAAAGDYSLVVFNATGPLPPSDAVGAVLARYAKEHLSTLKTGVAFERLLRAALGAADRHIGEVGRFRLPASD
jgi:hypothetical protein